MANALRGESARPPTPDSAQRTAPRPRPGVLQIPPYFAGRSSAAGAAKPIKLSSNECALGASPKAMAALRDAAADVHRYPDSTASALRAAIGAYNGVPADQIVCGDGSDELLHLLTQAYAGPGDEVLYSEHGFVVYPMVALAVGAAPIKSAEQRCRVDVDAMLARVSPRTRVVFVANPNSTGTCVPAAEVERLWRRLPPDVLLVLDAAYAEFVEAKDYDPGTKLVQTSNNTVMTRTFSKAFGLAGVRLGWALCPPAIADVLNRLRAPFNVTMPAQRAGIAALDDHDFVSAVRGHNARWRPWLEEELAALGLEPVPSVANFVLTRFPSGAAQANAANAHLTARGVLVREMGAYGLGDCLRITVGREDELNALIAGLKDFLGKSK
jgi:histidinol-phosphate aminotransferase